MFVPGLFSEGHRLRGTYCSFISRIGNSLYSNVLQSNINDLSSSRNEAHYLVSLLKDSSRRKAFTDGNIVHARAVEDGLDQSTQLCNMLIFMYLKCAAIEEAQSVFYSMSQHNHYSWSIIIGAYVDHGLTEESITLLQKIFLYGWIPDKVMYVSLLGVCCNEGCLSLGRILHLQTIECTFNTDVVVGTALITLYNKCGGSTLDAHRAFDNILEHNSISCNALILVYVDHGQPDVALYLFSQMQTEGVLPDRATFVTILPICRSLLQGLQIHVCLTGTDLESQIGIVTSLIHIYGKFGNLRETEKTFDKTPVKNTICWNAYISASTQNKCMNSVCQLTQMFHEGLFADDVTFIGVLGACCTEETIKEVKRLHVYIVYLGYISFVTVQTALVKAYSSCNSVEDAWRVFNEATNPTLISWNTILGVCVQNGRSQECLQLFKQMQLQSNIPDKITFTTVLSACANQCCLVEGMCIHALAVGNDLESNIINTILNMYSKGGALDLAWSIFDDMGEWNMTSCNIIFSALTNQIHHSRFCKLFQQMVCEGGMLNHITCVAIMSSCAEMAALYEGRLVHARISGSLIEKDITVGNAIINMYGKCGCPGDAKRMFQRMLIQNIVTWNSIIGVFSQHGMAYDALMAFNKMQDSGVGPDRVTFFNVLAACSHGGLLTDGFCHFLSMYDCHNVTPIIEHFNCMISLLGRTGQLDEGEVLLHLMPFSATITSWLSLLGFCNVHIDSTRGKQVGETVFELDPENAANMYAQEGM